MTIPRGFLSFDFDHDAAHKALFAGQAKTSSPTPFRIQDWSSKAVLPQRQWEAAVQGKMARTDMCIVLVGTHMASASGVTKEIAMARRMDIPVFGVYVNGAGTRSSLPGGLRRNRVIAWRWAAIATAVDQMMKERQRAR